MSNITDEIERLEALRDRGVLSENEFEKAKARLLETPNAPAVYQSNGAGNSAGLANEELYILGIHLGQLLSGAGGIGIILPIALWVIGKDKSSVVDAHGKNVVNWLISLLIYLVISWVLCFVGIGFISLPLFLLLAFIFPIIGAIKGMNGQIWEYPLTIRFIK